VENELDDDVFETVTINCPVSSRAHHPKVDSMGAMREMIVGDRTVIVGAAGA